MPCAKSCQQPSKGQLEYEPSSGFLAGNEELKLMFEIWVKGIECGSFGIGFFLPLQPPLTWSASFFFPSKPHFSMGIKFLPLLTSYSMHLVTSITLVNCCAELPIKCLQYDALNVLENRVTISLSKNRKCTCAARSLHLRAYSFMLSLSFFSRLNKLVLSGGIFILYLYYLINASTKSFHLWILVLSSFMYKLNVALLKLS